MFYSIVLPANNLSLIAYLAFDGFFWSEPETAAFSGAYKDLEPAFSPDGKKLFFVSKRPVSGSVEKKDYDIWYVEPEKGWENAINLGSPVNSDEDEYYPSIASNGNLYFTAKYNDSFGLEDIYFPGSKTAVIPNQLIWENRLIPPFMNLMLLSRLMKAT